MSLNILIMGPAGAGKGTMSEKIMETYHIPHLSTGDMFRAEVKNNTQLGQEAKSYMDKGQLVPDELTVGILLARIAQDDCQNGYLLDGFPRSTAQVEAFENKVKGTSLEVNLVINLDVDNEVLIERIENRRICQNCGAVYNLKVKAPAVEGVCDECGGKLYQRSDDNRESLQKRLQSYQDETFPVLQYYREFGLVVDVDATQSIEKVWQQVNVAIDNTLKEDLQ